MALSVNKILYITLLVCLFLLLLVMVGIQHNIRQFNSIMILICIIILTVMATLSIYK